MSFRPCLPQTRIARLQGRRYRLAELRLLDIARLERLADDRRADPLAAGRAGDPDGYHDRLRAAYDRAEAAADSGGGASWGDPEVLAAVFGSPRGAVLYLGAVLRLNRPRLGRDTLRLLAGCLLPEEWAEIGRAAFAADELDEISALIDNEIGVRLTGGSGGGSPWPEAVAAACKLLRKTPGEVMRLTPGELNLVLGDGKPKDRAIEKPRGMGMEEFKGYLRKKREFWREWEAAKKEGEKKAKGGD